ncbi:MAG: phospholipid-binding protein MlaC [Candidatus Omnitrophota bacterium]
MKKTTFLPLFTLIVLSLCSPSMLWADDTPGQLVINTINQGMQILKDPELKNPDQLEIRRQKLWEILEPIFSFEEVSMLALGRHWLDLNPNQQKEFTDSFTNILKDIYLKKSDDYQDGEIIYVREIVKGTRSKVQTNFVKGGKKIVVDFSMKKIDNVWKIYDITIETVSVLTNYRTQFNSILAKSSFDELMAKLRKKEIEVSN